MRWVAIRVMSITPGLQTGLIVLEVLSLGSKHPTELVVALVNKVTKSGILRSNISLKEYLLLLHGPKGGLQVGIVSRVWLGGRARSGLTRMRAWRIGCGLSNLGITRYPI